MKKLLLCALLIASTSYAIDNQSLVVTEENDLFGIGGGNQDRHYTQGLKFTYLASDKDFAGITSTFNKWAPLMTMTPECSNVGFVFGQNIYTPINTSTATPSRTDRPYAGWLYGGLVFQRRGMTFNNIETLDSYELDLGVVGPSAIGEQVQSQWHRWIGDTLPQGWNNQLKNEPGMELKYARYLRLTFDPYQDYGDFIAHYGCSLGNIRTLANAGGIFRFGYNLPKDFGPSLIDGTAPAIAEPQIGKWFSFYTIMGFELRAIAHDIFLDGNTFASSPRVERTPMTGDFVYGGGMRCGDHIELSYVHVLRGQQSHTQAGGDDRFGSITIKASWKI